MLVGLPSTQPLVFQLDEYVRVCKEQRRFPFLRDLEMTRGHSVDTVARRIDKRVELI